MWKERPGIKTMQAAGRLRPGEMNRTEAAYGKLLNDRLIAGEIIWYAFEFVTLKIAADTRYTPDFAVLLANRDLEFHEVKGFAMDDSMVKIKVAARLFPARFYLIHALPKKLGGGWDIKEVPA